MSDRLYQIRTSHRISQWAMAVKTGVHQSRISLIERGLVKPREEEKKKLAKELGVKVEELF